MVLEYQYRSFMLCIAQHLPRHRNNTSKVKHVCWPSSDHRLTSMSLCRAEKENDPLTEEDLQQFSRDAAAAILQQTSDQDRLEV